MNIFIFDYLIYYTFKSQQIGNVRGVIFVTDEFCSPPLICKQIIVYVIIFLCWQRLPLVGIGIQIIQLKIICNQPRKDLF